ncbi:hypothetical protein Llab_1805 [Lactococcus lactis]|nr:hypothetical protein Llab_1805 [Lactococcus lactis]
MFTELLFPGKLLVLLFVVETLGGVLALNEFETDIEPESLNDVLVLNEFESLIDVDKLDESEVLNEFETDIEPESGLMSNI